jgi:hypothetical protein
MRRFGTDNKTPALRERCASSPVGVDKEGGFGMPRYFFNVPTGDLFEDWLGSELANPDEAREEATGFARDLMRSAESLDWSNWVVKVTDTDGNVVLDLSFDAVKPAGTRH